VWVENTAEFSVSALKELNILIEAQNYVSPRSTKEIFDPQPAMGWKMVFAPVFGRFQLTPKAKVPGIRTNAHIKNSSNKPSKIKKKQEIPGSREIWALIFKFFEIEILGLSHYQQEISIRGSAIMSYIKKF
jgi:hypothetical protein